MWTWEIQINVEVIGRLLRPLRPLRQDFLGVGPALLRKRTVLTVCTPGVWVRMMAFGCPVAGQVQSRYFALD